MLLVVAGARDEAARRLARRWAAHDARLLSPRDLSCPGWVVGDVDPSAARAVVAGHVVPVGAVRGVLTTISSIVAADLPHVHRRDRGYCAAEMTAFLAWWISGLPVPAVNRPTATCLDGPGWRDLTWSSVAAGLGMRCDRTRWAAASGGPVPLGDDRDCIEVPVVAGQSVRQCPAEAARSAEVLARTAQVEALTVRLRLTDAVEFVGARPGVDVDESDCADAVLSRLFDPGGAR